MQASPYAEPSAAPTEASSTRSWVALWSAGLLALLLYLPSVGFDYTLDDTQAILGHPAVRGDAPWWECFTREFWGRPIGAGQWSSSYRPLTTLSFAIEHRVTARPWLHHLVNAIAYALLCVQVGWLARRWVRGPYGPAAVAALFAVLPIHVESTASLVGRADILAVIAALAAIEWSLPVLVDPRWQGSRPERGWATAQSSATRAFGGAFAGAFARAAAASCAYLVGLLCKESVALVPLVAGWLVVVEQRRTQGADNHGNAGLVARWLPVAGLGAVGAVYLLIRRRVLDPGLPPDFVAADNLLILRDGLARGWGTLSVLGHYTELLIVPMRLCSDHTYADIIPSQGLLDADAPWAFVGLGVAVLAIVDGARALRGRGPGLFAAALCAYALVGHFVIPLSVLLAERLALWPSVWVCVAIVAAVAPRTPLRAVEGGGQPSPSVIAVPGRRLAALIGILGLLLAGRTIVRSFDWRDDPTLHEADVQTCPGAVHSRFIYANVLRERGAPREAVWQYAVAAAGRSAFPGPFVSPMLEAEQTLSLDERLAALGQLAQAPDPLVYLRSLERYLLAEHAMAEARIVRALIDELVEATAKEASSASAAQTLPARGGAERGP